MLSWKRDSGDVMFTTKNTITATYELVKLGTRSGRRVAKFDWDWRSGWRNEDSIRTHTVPCTDIPFLHHKNMQLKI